MPPAQQAFAEAIVSATAVRQFDVCGVDSRPRSTSTLLASIAANCGANPWSDDTNVFSLRSCMYFWASRIVASEPS